MSDETPAAAPPAATETQEQKADAMAVDEHTTAPADDKPADDGQATTEREPVNGETSADVSQEASGGDTEMTGTADAGDKTATSDANGTPASDKKARRKSSGVPEHKTKKTLSRKKSVKEFHTNAQVGELYLVRMKGHPSWPSIIADDDMLPEAIAARRPVTAPNADGTWRRDEYAPGGKRHHERTFPVMFLHTNEFAWIPNGDLQPLTPEECKDVSEKSKTKALIAAYHEASEGHDLAHYKTVLNEHADAVAEDEAAQAEREAEKTRKADKKAKRKSDAAAATGDEMDVDQDGADTKPKGKKRKKDAGEGDGNEKPAKTPKTTKLKLSTPKTPATAEKSAKKKEPGTKSTKKKTPAKAIESDEAETPVPEKELTAEEKHAKREQEVKYCRHKLQRGLLTRDNVPSDDEVKTMSTYLKKLEDYPELEASIIRATKIHKVLKAMIKLQSIPRDTEYNFKKRSIELLAKWNTVLSDSPDDKDAREDAAPATNGESKPAEETEKTEAAPPKAEEPAEKNTEEKTENTDQPKADAVTVATGTGVEGEKEAEKEKPAEPAAKPETDEPDVATAPAEEYKPSTETIEPTAA